MATFIARSVMRTLVVMGVIGLAFVAAKEVSELEELGGIGETRDGELITAPPVCLFILKFILLTSSFFSDVKTYITYLCSSKPVLPVSTMAKHHGTCSSPFPSLTTGNKQLQAKVEGLIYLLWLCIWNTPRSNMSHQG
jgi:hypothetical protein